MVTALKKSVSKIRLPSARHLEERLKVSQSVSQSGKQSVGQAGRQTGRQKHTVCLFQWWSTARAVLNQKKSVPLHSFPKKARGHTMCWRLAVGGWRLAVGDWQLVEVGGGWRRLVVGDWWLMVVGGWWLVAAGGWRLAGVSLNLGRRSCCWSMYQLCFYPALVQILLSPNFGPPPKKTWYPVSGG